MGEISWTSEQESAIKDRGHNLLLAAAAGSGKTAVLVERIIGLIKNDGVNIDEMLISTFTTAAASEMREKIYKKLQEEGRLDQIELMGHADISSLDSFAFSIVKRYYYLIGIDSALSVCDSTASTLLKEDALDELFEDFFSRGDEDFLFFLDCYDTKDKDDNSVRAMLLKLHDFLMAMPDPWGYLEKALLFDDAQAELLMSFARDRALFVLSKAKEYFVEFENRLRELGQPELADRSRDRTEFTDELCRRFRLDAEDGFLGLGEPRKYSSLAFKKSGLSDHDVEELKALRKHGTDLVKKLADEYGDLSKALLLKEQSAMRPALEIYFKLVKEFDKLYAEKKRLAKALDFSDINHFALRILENEAVCNEYKNRFKYIFIDEFQDTNSIQEAILRRIARGNNLFMVGDVKQSIYKFRLAEPEIFLSHYKNFKSGSDTVNRVIDLNMNFRSKAGIIECVNSVFSEIMTDQSCGIEYDGDAALRKGSRYNGELSGIVEFNMLDPSDEDVDEEISELKKNELEALQMASLIKKYHGAVIHDDESGKDRKLEYRDMVVLLRSTRSRGEIIYRTLLKAGIPVYLDRSEGYFDSVEIQVFLNFLKIIDNREQDIPLLSVLCCPVFGYSADELAEIRIFGNEELNRPDAAFNEVFYEYAKRSEKAAGFVAMLERFKKESEILPLAEFIYNVLLSTGYGDFTAAQNNGEQKLANLRLLVDRAERYERNNINGLTGFIRFAELLARNGKNIDIGPAKTVRETEDCVRIMTTHKSKGLEFSFVLIGGLSGRALGSADSSSYVLHKEYGCALKPVNPEKRNYAKTKLISILNQKKRQESLAEEIRLLYVAMTRAKDILVFSAGAGKSASMRQKQRTLLKGDVESASSHLDLIYPVLCDRLTHSGKKDLSQFMAERRSFQEMTESAILSGWPDAADADALKIINYPYFSAELPPKKKYSVSELAEKSKGAAARGHLSYSEDEPVIRLERPRFMSGVEHNLTGAERGTAYHSVMEHINFSSAPKSVGEIKSFIEALAAADILSRDQAECVDPEKIKAFLDSEIGRRAAASRELHKEASFVMKHEHEGHGVLVQGTIDCYFDEDGKYVLLDYKSDHIDRGNEAQGYERLKESYLPQLALYKEALEKISGRQVKETVLYLFSADKAVYLQE